MIRGPYKRYLRDSSPSRSLPKRTMYRYKAQANGTVDVHSEPDATTASTVVEEEQVSEQSSEHGNEVTSMHYSQVMMII